MKKPIHQSYQPTNTCTLADLPTKRIVKFAPVRSGDYLQAWDFKESLKQHLCYCWSNTRNQDLSKKEQHYWEERAKLCEQALQVYEDEEDMVEQEIADLMLKIKDLQSSIRYHVADKLEPTLGKTHFLYRFLIKDVPLWDLEEKEEFDDHENGKIENINI